MVNQQLADYLKEGIKRGFELSFLKQKLLEAGFKIEDVEEASSLFSEPVPKPMSYQEFKKQLPEKKSHKWVIWLVIIFFILGLGALAYFYYPDTLRVLNKQILGAAIAFEIYPEFTQCVDGAVRVYVQNTGTQDIRVDDWAIHKIDGNDVDIWSYANVKAPPAHPDWGIVIWVVGYSPGEHVVELGTEKENVKTYAVNCP